MRLFKKLIHLNHIFSKIWKIFKLSLKLLLKSQTIKEEQEKFITPHKIREHSNMELKQMILMMKKETMINAIKLIKTIPNILDISQWLLKIKK